MQEVLARVDGQLRRRLLPDPDAQVIPGLRWGRHDHALTPAYWCATAWMVGQPLPASYRLGQSLREEVAACLLGGFGIPAEVGLAAFERVRAVLRSAPRGRALPLGVMEEALQEPLQVQGRSVRYRFARQKARYVTAAVYEVDLLDEQALADVELRDRLTAIPGVGMKTASWVVRNWRSSDRVAILDVHLIRACQAMGVFSATEQPSRHYRVMERKFIRFCEGIGVGPAQMDAVMWGAMRNIPAPLLRDLLDPASAASNIRPAETRRTPCREAVEAGETTEGAAAEARTRIPA